MNNIQIANQTTLHVKLCIAHRILAQSSTTIRTTTTSIVNTVRFAALRYATYIAGHQSGSIVVVVVVFRDNDPGRIDTRCVWEFAGDTLVPGGTEGVLVIQ